MRAHAQRSAWATAEGGEWLSIRLLNSYRLFVAVALLIGFLAPAVVPFGAAAPLLFYVTAGAYLLAGLAFALTIRQRRPSASTQAHLHLYADIIALAIATYASGGAASGVGILLVVPIVGSGTLVPLRHALVYAALATVVLLGLEVVRQLHLDPVDASYPQAALLGATLFAAALLAAVVERRSRASAELARQRSRDVERLSALSERIIQQMEAGLLVVDPRGFVTMTNSSAALLLETEHHLAGWRLGELAPGLEAARAAWVDRGTGTEEPLRAHPDASRRLQVQCIDLADHGTLLVVEDAAFLEDQVQQLKLASLGRLTASIAHEIRNPLAAISHSAQLLFESDGLADGDRRLVEIMVSHCARMDEIVDNVLELSRQRRAGETNVDLRAWLGEFARAFCAQRGLAPDRLHHELPEQPVPIRFDPGQLEQIVANLCDNSLQHGRRQDGAPVTINLCPGRGTGGLPYLDVADDGIPIDSGRAGDIFEPFYTTSHSGTGLGLFLARELCAANRARLRFIARDDGNRFRVIFESAAETSHVQDG